MNVFNLTSKNKPAGDQPRAIKALTDGIRKGYRDQTLLGVTGSGKTFSIANVIQSVGKPTLVIAHNKTLAAQLTNEFRELFPHNSVNYFVSYYDYYQPEAYLPSSDTYIGKEAMVNDEIDKLRHAATAALLTRKDVIVVASVSCIYGLGSPELYAKNIFHLKPGDRVSRSEFSRKLVELQFARTNSDLKRATFRLRGDHWEIMPPDREVIYTFETKNDTIQNIYEVDPVQGFRPGLPGQAGKTPALPEIYIAPAKHFITPPEDRKGALHAIREELKAQLKQFEKEKKFLEAERLERRTKADMAMIREVGYCHGIENYSRHLSGRKPGEPPATLLDYFWRNNVSGNQLENHGQSASLAKPDFLTIIDESHVTIPQLQGMYHGDASRKKTLIEYGFRLPSAADNRPLKFKEFKERTGQTIYTSATPGAFEIKMSAKSVAHFAQTHTDKMRNGAEKSGRDFQRAFSKPPHHGLTLGAFWHGGKSPRLPGVVEQIIRPTGLVDPKVTIRPVMGQIDDLLPRIRERVKKKERVLVTTLTKRMAEDLASFLEEAKIKVTYLHSDVKTLDRIKILTNLRRGSSNGGFDVLVGVNLLREGLDLPEVSLVAILDADKEGFLRSETSLIQTIGRAARNVGGEVLLYADTITGSVQRAVMETERRRRLQLAYNTRHHITPKTIEKEIKDILPVEKILTLETKVLPKSKKSLEQFVKEKEKEMKEAANALDFELAAILRDEIKILREKTRKS